MVFGYRTPTKAPTNNDVDPQPATAGSELVQAGSSLPALSVRKSVGEWESGKPETRSSLTPPRKTATVGPPKPKPPAVRRLSVEAKGSPPILSSSKSSDRVAEAKACLIKGKLNLNNARNLRTDIKVTVIEALDRLYQIVKEADLTKGKSAKTQPKGSEKEEQGVEKEKVDTSCLEDILEKHAELIKENSLKMEALRESLEKKTYASVAAATTRLQQPVQMALHSVVVTAKDETETGEEVLERIRKVVNAKEGGVEVERIRKAKDRKVIVGCRTEEERRKVKERISQARELNVEDIKNKDPLVILRDVLQHNSDEDIFKALRTQNKALFRDIKKEDDRAEIAYKRRTRNPHTCHIVMRVSPKLWQHMTQAEAVHIDLQRVRVADQSPLVQCSLCLGYGHGRRFCKETLEKCSHCGGPHLKTQCADWLAGVTPTCCNCSHAKLEKTEHNAFSPECSIRRKWDALARATVAYC